MIFDCHFIQNACVWVYEHNYETFFPLHFVFDHQIHKNKTNNKKKWLEVLVSLFYISDYLQTWLFLYILFSFRWYLVNQRIVFICVTNIQATELQPIMMIRKWMKWNIPSYEWQARVKFFFFFQPQKFCLIKNDKSKVFQISTKHYDQLNIYI